MKANVGDFICTRETDKAILVSDGTIELWVPKSVVHDDSEVYAADTEGDLVLAEWWAEQNGLL